VSLSYVSPLSQAPMEKEAVDTGLSRSVTQAGHGAKIIIAAQQLPERFVRVHPISLSRALANR